MITTIALILTAAFLLLFFAGGVTNLVNGISRDPFGDFLALVAIGCVTAFLAIEIVRRLDH